MVSMISVLKAVLLVIVVLGGLNEFLAITEKKTECEARRSRALYALRPGGPCGDFETRVHLSGEFLKCDQAEKVARMNVYSCSIRSWLAGWLPSRIMAVVAEHFYASMIIAAALIVSTVYIIVAGVVHDRAHQRTMQMFSGQHLPYQPSIDGRSRQLLIANQSQSGEYDDDWAFRQSYGNRPTKSVQYIVEEPVDDRKGYWNNY